MAITKDLTNAVFTRLTVIKKVDEPKGKGTKWLCKCDCKNETIVSTRNLNYGHTKSCGCLQRDSVRNTGYKNKTHGETDTRLHIIWMLMRHRCFKLSDLAYKDYGARGITVCDAWLDYIAFRNWAMENGYKNNLTIDRKNNNGNYEPSNCRWVTMKEQCNNRRSNILVKFNGKNQTLQQWSDETGIKHSTLLHRYHNNWNIEDLFKQINKKCLV